MRYLLFNVYLLNWLFIIYLLYASFNYTISEPIWGPIDEIAHMDYIEKISKAKFTMNTDSPIETEIFQSFEYTQWAKPSNFDGTILTAGLPAISYELYQPPLYYIIMAVPNCIMKLFGVNIVNRVLIIRVISWFLFFLSLVIGYFSILKLLKKFKFSVSLFFAQLYMIYLLLVGSIHRFGISNDWLPLLIIHLIIWFFLKLYFENFNSVITWIHFLIAALMMTKQTYLPLSFIFFLTGMFFNSSFNKLKWKYLIYLPVILWYALFTYQILNPSITHSIFKFWFPPGKYDFQNFLIITIYSVFDWSKLISFSYIPGLWIFGIFGFSLLSSLLHKKSFPIIIYSMIVLFSLAIMMFCLNKWIGGVNWYAYRHFNGYGFFIFLGAFGWLICGFDKIKVYIQRNVS